MSRCLDSLSLYADDDDRERFLELLGRYLPETNCRCYAWALMRNHYHLVLHNGELDLWRTMKPLNMRYAQYHGKKHARRGPLFLDRYKSIVTQDQNYVQELVRYVHLNPVRSGTCKSLAELDRYPWCGHGAIMGKTKNSFQDTTAVLRRFGKDTSSARKAYRGFLAEGLGGGSDGELMHLLRSSNAGEEKDRGPQRWVIGDPDFVKKVLGESQARRLRLRRRATGKEDLVTLGAKVCKVLGIPLETLRVRHRGGAASQARKAFAFLAIRRLEFGTRPVAEFLGISPGAVSHMMREGEKTAKNHSLIER